MTTTKLEITGMTCGHCVKAVEGALLAQTGVSAAKVDLQSGRAEVQHTEAVEADRMIAAIEDEGYQARLAGESGG